MVNDNYQLQADIWQSQSLTTSEKIVALCLVWHRNKTTKQCNPSQERIAQETGLGLRTVRNVLKALERKGVITSKKTQATTRYKFGRAGLINGLAATIAGSDRQPLPVGKPSKPARTPRKRGESVSIYEVRSHDECGNPLVRGWELEKAERAACKEQGRAWWGDL